MTLRIGLVGAGRWGRNVIRTLARLPGVELASVASRNAQTDGVMPARCRRFEDWRDMIHAGGLDGLVIATPPDSHAEIALEALGAGLPLLIEKPLTQNIAQAHQIAQAAERADCHVQVDHIHLFSPAFRRLVIEARAQGPVRLTSRAGNRGLYRPDSPVLWDWLSHDLAMMLTVMDGLPLRVRATALAVPDHAPPLAEAVELRLEFPGGVTAVSQASNHAPEKFRRFEVETNAGLLVYDDLAPHKLSLSDTPIITETTPALDVVLTEFAAAIAGGSRDRSGLRLGVQVVEILGAL